MLTISRFGLPVLESHPTQPTIALYGSDSNENRLRWCRTDHLDALHAAGVNYIYATVNGTRGDDDGVTLWENPGAPADQLRPNETTIQRWISYFRHWRKLGTLDKPKVATVLIAEMEGQPGQSKGPMPYDEAVKLIDLLPSILPDPATLPANEPPLILIIAIEELFRNPQWSGPILEYAKRVLPWALIGLHNTTHDYETGMPWLDFLGEDDPFDIALLQVSGSPSGNNPGLAKFASDEYWRFRSLGRMRAVMASEIMPHNAGFQPHMIEEWKRWCLAHHTLAGAAAYHGSFDHSDVEQSRYAEMYRSLTRPTFDLVSKNIVHMLWKGWSLPEITWPGDPAPSSLERPEFDPCGGRSANMLTIHKPHAPAFGCIESRNLIQPLEAGIYEIKLEVERTGFAPVRLRVDDLSPRRGTDKNGCDMRPDGSESDVATLLYQSDGVSPWTIAVDLMGFGEGKGSLSIAGISARRVG